MHFPQQVSVLECLELPSTCSILSGCTSHDRALAQHASRTASDSLILHSLCYVLPVGIRIRNPRHQELLTASHAAHNQQLLQFQMRTNREYGRNSGRAHTCDTLALHHGQQAGETNEHLVTIGLESMANGLTDQVSCATFDENTPETPSG
jgi:hypothetical protein